MTDTEIIDWLSVSTERILDARGRIENEDVTLRQAVEWLAKAHEVERVERIEAEQGK